MSHLRRFVTISTAVGLSWFVLYAYAAQSQLSPTQDAADGTMERPDPPKTINFWQSGDPGQRLHIHGWVSNTDGKPIAGATMHVWQTDGTGEYQEDRYRASFQTAEDGSYRINTVLPGQYYGVKHIHVVVTHEDHEQLETRILFKGDPNLDEAAYGNVAIHLEEANVNGDAVLFGRFDIIMRSAGSS